MVTQSGWRLQTGNNNNVCPCPDRLPTVIHLQRFPCNLEILKIVHKCVQTQMQTQMHALCPLSLIFRLEYSSNTTELKKSGAQNLLTYYIIMTINYGILSCKSSVFSLTIVFRNYYAKLKWDWGYILEIYLLWVFAYGGYSFLFIMTPFYMHVFYFLFC